LKRTAVFTVAAEGDLAEALEWYRRRGDSLAQRLLAEIGSAINRLESNPLQFPIVHRDVRRALLRQYPYALFFRIIEDRIQVLACFHTRRDPRALRRRA
jgi:plasmid stabilization system protein ParE